MKKHYVNLNHYDASIDIVSVSVSVRVSVLVLLGTRAALTTLATHSTAAHILAHTLAVCLIGFILFGSHDLLKFLLVGLHLFVHLGTLTSLRALTTGLADAVALSRTLTVAVGTCSLTTLATTAATGHHHVCILCVE